MSAEKNHEQYLEQIEIAVAETTKELMGKHNGDLRAMAKVCAEKQIEINRLKEYQDDDRKTIRKLRKLLKEATADADLYKKANLHEHTSCYDGRMMLVKTLWGDGKEYEDRIDLDFPKINEKIEELKKEIELQKDYIDALPERLEEKQQYLEQAQLDVIAKDLKIEKLIDEIECIHSTLESKEGYYECEIIELNEKIAEKEKEVNTLKIQQEQLSGMGGVAAREGLNAISENHKLKEENKELKKEKEKFEEGYFKILKRRNWDASERKKLKKEIERLDEYTSDYDTEVEMRSLAEKELEELQNKHEDIVVENKELEKYKTWIHCVWSDLYWADKGGCEVSFKEVSASCDYYENEDFVKKEVVEDDDA